MEQKRVRKPRRVVERSIELTSVVMAELLANPGLLEQLPPDFHLVVLPEGEPDIWLYNLDLICTSEQAEKPVVFARIASSGHGARFQTSLYAPLAA